MPPAPDDGVWGRLAEASASGRGMAPGGDRRSLRLNAEDEDLIARTAAVQPRTVVVLLGGSAFVVEPWIDSVAAVLHAWYPGMEGGHAIADVLTGAVDPSGRLPFAVPTDEAHLADFDPDAKRIRYGRWHGQWLLDREGHAPRFPFGYGLSYTSICLASARARRGGIDVDVMNEGARDGATVVFVFRPGDGTKRLVAFRKVRVAAGETFSLPIELDEPGRVVVALHAGDPLSQTVEIPA
jgi:beta-glucosidase